MPALDALKELFSYGYSSGNVLTRIPGPHRILEQLRVGASYRQVFLKAIAPYIRSDSRVLELGPGRGSWTRAILEHVPDGEVHVVDFQDVRKWIKPKAGSGRLLCYRVSDNSFAAVPDDFFDFFWSFGVLCHNNLEHIREVLRNSLGKLKPGAIAVHQIADWNKLNALNWSWRYGVPARFKQMPDDEIWWPRNDAQTMCQAARKEGWEIVSPDLGLLRRDSLCVLRRAEGVLLS